MTSFELNLIFHIESIIFSEKYFHHVRLTLVEKSNFLSFSAYFHHQINKLMDANYNTYKKENNVI
jgi:hypothetical protein